MKLVMSSWYNEPKFSFKISHKVDNLIRDLIIEDILKPRNIYRKTDVDFVCIEITTGKSVKKAFLSEPIFDKKNNFTTYRFWLPYEEIVYSKDSIKSYINSIFLILTDFLRIYDIEASEVDKLKSKIEIIVLNNDDYLYDDQNDDLDIGSIISDLGIE